MIRLDRNEIIGFTLGATCGYGLYRYFDFNFFVGFPLCTAVFVTFGQFVFREKPRVINDPVFGRLLFFKAVPPHQSYWEGGGVFEPTESRIEFLVEADEAGPGETQRVFYQKFSKFYPELQSLVGPLLQQHHEKVMGVTMKDDPWKLFKLSALDIPLVDRPDVTWEVNFEFVEPITNPLYTVEMKDWRPTGLVYAE